MDFEDLQISSGASSSAGARGANKETCALCPRPGLRCENCWQVNYCSKEHQVKHRPIHKAQCKPYKVCTNSTLGRHLVATRPIQAMTPILTSKPTVLGPMKMKRTVCLGCGKKMSYVGEFLQCSLCGFPMCSKACQKNPLHASECAAVHARGLEEIKDLSMVENSCLPNAMAVQKVGGCTKATLIATEVIQPGEHISISYQCPGLGNISCQMGACLFWHFFCMCRRCMDPTELGLYVNSICCSKCQQLGKMTLIPVANPELETASWECPGCSTLILRDEVVIMHNTLTLSYSAVPNNVEAHMSFLEKNLWPRGLLHPMHELIMLSKHKIINSTTYGDFPEYVEMLKDLERFYRKSSPAMYLADMYRMEVLLAEVLNIKKQCSSQGDRQKMKEKLLSLEDEIQKPLSCYMSESDQLSHKTATDKIKRHISEIKLE